MGCALFCACLNLGSGSRVWVPIYRGPKFYDNGHGLRWTLRKDKTKSKSLSGPITMVLKLLDSLLFAVFCVYFVEVQGKLL